MIMDASASAIRSMVDQVFELDSALTEWTFLLSLIVRWV
jgi:hypothetical protein